MRTLICTLVASLGWTATHANENLIQLSAPSHAVASTYRISTDGEFVVYDLVGNADALYSVRARGGTPVRLTVPPVAGLQVTSWRISEDSSRVAFEANQVDLTRRDLFSVPIAGPAGAAVRLSSTHATLLRVADATVYFREDCGEHRCLYRVPIEGPASSKQLLHESTSSFSNSRFSPDNQWFVFSGEGSLLQSLRTDGTGTVRTLTPGPVSSNPFGIISRDSTRVVVTARPEPTVQKLYSVPIDGTSADAIDLSGVVSEPFARSTNPDDSRVVFSNGNFGELYSVPIEGPSFAADELTGPLIIAGKATVTPDGSQVVYPTLGPPQELFAVPIEGPASSATLLSDPLASSFIDYEISETSDYLVIHQRRFNDALNDGYRIPLDDLEGPGELIWTIGLDVEDFSISPSGRQVLMEGLQVGDTDRGLWTAALTGSPTFERELLRESDLPDNAEIASARWGPDGSVFLLAGDLLNVQYQLFTIPLLFRDDFERGDATGWSAAVP